MPQKKAGSPAGGPVVRSESLLATDTEAAATSKSLYGDHKARISSNVHVTSERVRTNAFRNAMQQGAKGKNVLHLGCGVGLFSMIAARTMAKLVVAVDTSNIVEQAAEVAKQNGLNNLKFFRGEVEKIRSELPDVKFDIIMCEWMGAFLTNEKSLRELIYCRDNLLAANGVICPNNSTLHVVGISDYQYYQSSVEYWENVYGFSMKPMKPLVMKEASTCAIPKSCIMTSPAPVHTVDVQQLKGNSDDELSWSSDFTIRADKKGTLHFLTFYVDCNFTNPNDPGSNFVIGFNPGAYNCWTEVSLPLNEHIPLNVGDKLTGTIKCVPREKGTHLSVEVTSTASIAPVKTSGEYVYTY